MAKRSREERLQIMLTEQELTAVDTFRFKTRMPSRAAAVRELLKRGMAAEGLPVAAFGAKSTESGAIGKMPAGRASSPRSWWRFQRRYLLVDLDADRLDDGAPFGDFRFQQLCQRLGRGALGHIARLRQLVLERRIRERRVGIGADLADYVG